MKIPRPPFWTSRPMSRLRSELVPDDAPTRDELVAGLLSLKGEEEVRVGNFKTTRVISYRVLNRAVDRILGAE